MKEPEFEFQKLDVYQLAMELKRVIVRIARELPRGSGDLRHHLVGSDRSIRLNIAEGAGKHRPGGKAERFRTARGSANECAAALDEVKEFDLAPRTETLQAIALCHRIIAMLTRLILYWESQAEK